jgi:hypothetical protein
MKIMFLCSVISSKWKMYNQKESLLNSKFNQNYNNVLINEKLHFYPSYYSYIYIKREKKENNKVHTKNII